MNANLILGLIGGLGIGSLLTSVVNHYLAKRSGIADRLYQEKRASFLGMARALYDAEIEPCPKNEKMFGYHLNLAKIFASEKVVIAAQKVIDSGPGSKARISALEELHEAMRKDLHVKN